MKKMVGPFEQAGAREGLCCVQCGYDLRGGGGEVCPECGFTVEGSRELGAPLSQSHAGWVTQLAAGMLLVCHTSPALAFAAFDTVDMRTSVATLLLVSMVQWGACQMLARPKYPDIKSRIRPWAVHLMAAFPVLANAVAIVWWRMDLPRPDWACALAIMAFAPCLPLHYGLLRNLAQRMIRHRLMEHLTILALGYPPVFVFAVAIEFRNFGVLDAAITPVDIAILVPLILFWWWSMAVLAYCVVVLMRAAQQARKREAPRV